MFQELWKRGSRRNRRPVRDRRAHQRPKRLLFESLEDRRLLAATDMAEISGRVFRDQTGNGFDSGEEIAGVTLQLYVDDGDSIFEPGAGDVLQTSEVSDAAGLYSFENLMAGGYFVRQTAGNGVAETVSGLLTITAGDAAGTQGVAIDNFSTTAHSATASTDTGGTNPDDSFADTAANETLGNERDLFAEVTSGIGAVSMSARAFGQDLLQFDSSSGVQGNRQIVWDGDDDDATSIDFTGLGGFDLTEAGDNTALELEIGADQSNGQVQITIYSSSTAFSSVTTTLPNTGGASVENLTIPFSDFAQGTGASSVANFASIGAIELVILSSASSVDGRLDFIGTIGPTVFTQNFPNFDPVDLTLTKTVDNSTPDRSDLVTFTVSLSNEGANAATNIEVTDNLPAGLNVQSITATSGSYNSNTGIWSIPQLESSTSVTLTIEAFVTSASAVQNVAEVTAVDQFDTDSTPNNNDPNEDDQDSVTVTPQVADLSLTKSVDNSTPAINDSITFTLTLTNSGPQQATNVVISDPLPATLSFQSADAQQGSYNSGTGLWTVGTIASGSSLTLDITATVAGGSAQTTNTAQVFQSDQFDTDSTPGNNDPSEDDQASASLTPAAQLAGRVFTDTDNDGVADAGESGIANVMLVLSGTSSTGGTVNLSTTTDANGDFLFEGVPASNGTGYTLVEAQPAGFLDGQDRAGTAGGIPAPVLSDSITQIVLVAGQSATGYTFGELAPSSISGLVYYDASNDGSQQANEPGISGATITLTGVDDLGNNVSRSATTGTGGSYQFDNLRPSNPTGYTVTETSVPAPFIDGLDSQGTPPLGNVADDSFSALVLPSGTILTNYNFGELAPLVSKRRFLASAR